MTQTDRTSQAEDETIDVMLTQSLLGRSDNEGMQNGNSSNVGKSVIIMESKFEEMIEEGAVGMNKIGMQGENDDSGALQLHYNLEDTPPWYTCLMLGMQHYLTFVVGIVSLPLIMCPRLCMLEDDPARGYIVSTLIFVSGMVTLLQTTFGVRIGWDYSTIHNTPDYCSDGDADWSGAFQCGRQRSFRQLVDLRFVMLSIVIMWLLCGLLTVTGILEPGNLARTDSKSRLLDGVMWFRVPYPGQWGLPTASAAAVVGMLAGVVSGAIESVGDYYACAKFCGVPPPPIHAVNRGIGTEGVGCLLGGLWGTGNGTTSFSQNIGVIGVTKVGSRRVVQWAGGLMMILGVFSKVGSFFITIPGPVIGGVFCITFGMVAAVGISTLHFVSLHSFRNMYIIGFSLFFALVLPQWMEKHPDAIKTGSEFIDQMFTVLLSTSMFVGGFIGFVLDNTVPGTPEERGLTKWKKQHEMMSPGSKDMVAKCYNLPFGMDLIRRYKILQKVPCFPKPENEIPEPLINT
ncbi:hypothetical protein J437_LFUL016395 [Ladona fulva]|uniref:Solute carrier family 23 member 2 n=1 Tax=Ladona fulva TaxID=123851 RepID=A0A8K0NWM3_LADFU|nr:hypothetical protein J437_LFUL016395 [Ladona fulva]